MQTGSALQIVPADYLTGIFERRHVGHYGRAGDQAFLKSFQNCLIDRPRHAEIVGVHDDVPASSCFLP
jgi:hypothetical protein